MLVRHRALLVAVVVTAAQIGCGDLTSIRATFSNLEATRTVYAMNGTAITLPSALAIRSTLAVLINENFLFDVAFDIDSTGKVLAYTQARMANQLVATHRVGLLVSDSSFAQVIRAPTSGYVYDSIATLPFGKTLLVDVLEQSCGGSFLGVNVRAKIAIDSVRLATRSIYLRVLSNPNCGFRSLVPGEPKD